MSTERDEHGNVPRPEGYTQVVVWQGTVVEDEQKDEFEAFLVEQFGLSQPGHLLESVTTVKDDTGPGGRIDVLFTMPSDVLLTKFRSAKRSETDRLYPIDITHADARRLIVWIGDVMDDWAYILANRNNASAVFANWESVTYSIALVAEDPLVGARAVRRSGLTYSDHESRAWDLGAICVMRNIYPQGELR